MNRFLITSLLALSLPAYGAEDQSKARLLQIGQPVFATLNSDGTWNGGVQVSASPCTDQPRISTGFGFKNVKTQEEVFDQLALQLDATARQAEELEKMCKK